MKALRALPPGLRAPPALRAARAPRAAAQPPRRRAATPIAAAEPDADAPGEWCAPGFATVDSESHAGATVLTVEVRDYPGLVRVLAWGLGGLGVAVDNAHLTTTDDGIAINTFWLTDGRGRKLSKARADSLADRVADLVAVCAPSSTDSHATSFVGANGRVTVDNAAHPSLTVVSVGPGADGVPPPLLVVASAVSGAGITIREAVVRGGGGGAPAATDGTPPGALRLWLAEPDPGGGKLPSPRCAALAYTLGLALDGGGAVSLTPPVPGAGGH